ncbi:MAG TPA: iron transporter [Trebonia sp.]
MTAFARLRGTLRHAAPLALITIVVAGCASGSPADKSGASPAAMSSSMSGMSMAATPNAAGAAAASSEAAAGGSGITPVPAQVLGTAVWQGMKITAMAMTPVAFDIYNGTAMQPVKPPKNVSFHLMVLLNDAQTNVVLPYASVWGTIKEGSRTSFDESLWPMISRYMGPHYGNDVVLPGSGTYQLSLLISPPVSGRHVEYQGVWLKAHTVTFTFRWHQPS